jgi:hypothetical protein
VGNLLGRGKHLNGKIEGGGEILTHEEALELLSEMAKSGSVTAAVALERCASATEVTMTMRIPFGPSWTRSGRLAGRGLMTERRRSAGYPVGYRCEDGSVLAFLSRRRPVAR